MVYVKMVNYYDKRETCMLIKMELNFRILLFVRR